MDNHLHELVKFITDRAGTSACHFDGRYVILHSLTNAEFSSINEILKRLNVAVQGSKDEISIDLNISYPDNTFLFFDKKNFLKNYDRYRDAFDAKNLVILTSENGPLIKESSATYSDNLRLFFNFHIYRQILDFLLKNTDFTTLHELARFQLVILSQEKGAFPIGYDLVEEKVGLVNNLTPVFEHLQKQFEKLEFVNFFKDIVIQGVHSEHIQGRFWAMITAMEALISLAERDFQLYVRKFAFDKIKSKFKEEKTKYFDSLEKNIESLQKQVVAFPLTFAASAYASYQVKDKPAIIILIALAFGFYTWVAWKVLNISAYNVASTKEDVNKESEKIQSSYNILFTEFEPDFNKINTKIALLESLIKLLRYMLLGLLLTIVFLWAYYSFINPVSPTPPAIK